MKRVNILNETSNIKFDCICPGNFNIKYNSRHICETELDCLLWVNIGIFIEDNITNFSIAVWL